MQSNPLVKWIGSNFERIAMAAAKGIYPFPFKAAQSESVDCRIEEPIVSHQLVCSERAQIMVFLIMDLGSLANVAAAMFKKLPRNEGIQMAVSANNELLNITSSKLAAVLTQVESTRKSILTPPLVMGFGNEAAITVAAEDSLHYEFKSDGISFKLITTVQTV